MAQLIGLADALDDLRAELADSIQRSKAQPLRFKIDKIELELNVAVEDNRGVGGKVEFKILGWGLGADGSASRKAQQGHKVKLILDPKGLEDDDGETYASDEP